ncbi:MAG: FAD:protein FMN transferase [Actinomycetota bacterium]
MDDGTTGELHSAVHEPLLGTRVTIRLRATDARVAEAAERAVVAEIERLESVLSAYRTDSEWSRWRRGELDRPGPEIVALLEFAAHWHSIGGGAFNPLVGVLRARWLRAVHEQVLPSPDEMVELAAGIVDLPYRVVGGAVERTGDCALVDLHAIAKGWIVDRAVRVAVERAGVREVVVNAGGDLLHRGPAAITVGIEDPRRSFDNVPPLTSVVVRDAGVASSSGARRPLRIGDTKLSHVLDPCTGWPVEHTLAATAIAPDAATADVLATITGVLPIATALHFADSLPGVCCLLLDGAGAIHASARWPRRADPTAQARAM